MKRRNFIIVLLCLLLISNVATYRLTRFFPSTPVVEAKRDEGAAELLWEVWDILEKKYYQELNQEEMIRGAIKGMLNSLDDPYTAYLKPEELEEMRALTIGFFGGIGVEITEDGGEILILRVMEDTPAGRAGLLPGDRIVLVGNVTMEHVTLDEAARLLRGPQGTRVNLTIRRPGEQGLLNLTLTRADIEVETVFARLVSPQIGCIRVTSFDQNTGENFLKALSFLEKQKLGGLIIDLRNNPGGLLDEAINVGKIIVPQGEITKVVDRWGKIQECYYSSAKPKDYPIVVLINEYTASAAEIVAGALQDRKKSLLVGMPTFGKATVQYLQSLSDNGGLRYTVGRYLTPAGRDLSHHGLQPDLEVKLPPSYYLQHQPVPKNLEQGETGETVVLLQNMINFLDCPLEVTGIMDTQTIKALQIFQGKHGLPPTGSLNHQTREKLRLELIRKSEQVDTQLEAAVKIIKKDKIQAAAAGE
jgi:carboxyl-terminal processing protease